MPDEVLIKVVGADIHARLNIPNDSKGLVIFSYGSEKDENDRHLNQYVSGGLNKRGVATLVFDLLSADEIKKKENLFNIDLMTDRLVGITKWCLEHERTKILPMGYLGVGTGAAAALSAAAYWGGLRIKAVVSREGRPDLAGEVLDLVESPALLMVTIEDRQMIDYNRQAYIHLGCEKKTEMIMDTKKILEDEDLLNKVTDLVSKWFLRHFEQS